MHAMHYVYLIESLNDSTRRYVGSTADLRQRLADHNAGKSLHTAPQRPWRLVAYIAFANKGAALEFERYL